MKLLKFATNLFGLSSLVVALVGCSSTSSHFHSDGRLASVASCTGPSWVSCYERAGALCQSAGYETLEKHSTREVGFLGGTELKQIIFVCKNLPQSQQNIQAEPVGK